MTHSFVPDVRNAHFSVMPQRESLKRGNARTVSVIERQCWSKGEAHEVVVRSADAADHGRVDAAVILRSDILVAVNAMCHVEFVTALVAPVNAAGRDSALETLHLDARRIFAYRRGAAPVDVARVAVRFSVLAAEVSLRLRLRRRVSVSDYRADTGVAVGMAG